MSDEQRQFDELELADDLPPDLRQLFTIAHEDIAPTPDVTARVRERIAALPRGAAAHEPVSEPLAELRSRTMLVAAGLATLAASIAAIVCLREAAAMFDPMSSVLQSFSMVMP